MSEDLIKRSDAIEAVENVTWYHQNRNKDMVKGANSDEHQAWYKSQDIYEALEAVLSADRSQGEWKPKNHHTDYCSNCGFEETQWRTADYNFCPLCGARMKGTDDE